MLHSFIIGIHALIGWGICGSIIGIGRKITTMKKTLILHAIAVPIVFGVISVSYFHFFGYTSPRDTAAIFFVFALVLDAGLVAPFIEKSFDMFFSKDAPLGTWLPLASIFAVTYLIGIMI
jgi:hypothetical protein